MDNDLDMAALRVFRSVAREGSFTAAAKLLRLPKSTVSKRVGDLEAQLGVRLIERTTRAFRLTSEGTVLLARAERLLADAEDIRRLLSDAGQAPRGHLRIAVPHLFGLMHMGRLGAAFRARHPDITLECTFLDRPADMLEEGFDGMLRVGPLEDSGAVARHLGTASSVLVAAPGFPGTAALRDPACAGRLPIVGYAPAHPAPWSFVHRDGETHDLRPQPVLSLGSALAVRDAVIAGAGISLLPHFLASPEIEAGRLVNLLPEWEANLKEMHFLYPSPLSATTRLRAFIAFLLEDMRSASAGWRPPGALPPPARATTPPPDLPASGRRGMERAGRTG